MLKLATNEWRLTDDYQNIKAKIPSKTDSIPNITEMKDDIQTAQGSCFAIHDPANMFYSFPKTDSQPQFVFSFEGTGYTFTQLAVGYLNSPAIAHNLCK